EPEASAPALASGSRLNGASRPHRADLLRVDLELVEGLPDDGGLELAALGQLRQGGHGDALRIDLEEAPQGRPRLAAAAAVGPQPRRLARGPFPLSGDGRSLYIPLRMPSAAPSGIGSIG